MSIKCASCYTHYAIPLIEDRYRITVEAILRVGLYNHYDSVGIAYKCNVCGAKGSFDIRSLKVSCGGKITNQT